MSERDTPIAKGYVDDVAWILLVVIAGVIIMSILMHYFQAVKINDLQRRVAELESRTK